MSRHGHPIVGDKTYSVKKRFNPKGQLLHAYKVGFIHPISGSIWSSPLNFGLF